MISIALIYTIVAIALYFIGRAARWWWCEESPHAQRKFEKLREALLNRDREEWLYARETANVIDITDYEQSKVFPEIKALLWLQLEEINYKRFHIRNPDTGLVHEFVRIDDAVKAVECKLLWG